jgi:hypothetical protein
MWHHVISHEQPDGHVPSWLHIARHGPNPETAADLTEPSPEPVTMAVAPLSACTNDTAVTKAVCPKQ